MKGVLDFISSSFLYSIDRLNNIVYLKNKLQYVGDTQILRVGETKELELGIYLYMSINWGGYPSTILGVISHSSTSHGTYGFNVHPLIQPDSTLTPILIVDSTSIKINDNVLASHGFQLTKIGYNV